MRRSNPLLAILRPLNGSMAGAAVLVGSVLGAEGGLVENIAPLVLLTASAFLMTGGGNILNDIDDVKIDKKAHPDRPLASGELSEKHARLLLGLAWTAGIVCSSIASLLLKALLPSIIVLSSLCLILLYEKLLKKRGLSGNFTIGLLTGAPFVLGASASDLSPMVMVLFILAFLSNTSREIMKDIQDMDVDRRHRTTLPVLRGADQASRVGFFIMALAVLLSFVPFAFLGFDPFYLACIVVADTVLVFSAIWVRKDPIGSQRMAKLGMLAAMAVFVLWKYH